MGAEKRTLVTGATRGIGRAVVTRLVAAGRSVVACARDAALLEELERAAPGRVRGVSADLTEPGAPLRVIEQVERELGPLDELVYAAGVVHYQPIGAIDERALRAQLELNFVAPLLMMQRLGASLRQRGTGAMVVIASTLASRSAPSTAAYAASKAALVSAARSCALELAPSVRVNVVAPGVVDTDMVRAPRRPLEPGESAAGQLEAQLALLRALHPLGRLGATEEVAEAVHYLLDAAWVTGSVLTVDGGLSCA